MENRFANNSKINNILKATLFCIVFTLLLIVFSFFKSLISPTYERLAYGVIGTAVAFTATYLFLRIDKKSFRDIGLNFEQTTLKKFFAGVLFGIILMGTATLFVISYSSFKFETNPNGSILYFLLSTFPLLILAFMEEVGFRAYPLIILKQHIGIRIAIMITSLLFALYHIANGWSISSAFMGTGVCAIIFGAAAIYANGIAMPTGIHYAFNLTTAAFGITNDSYNLFTLKQQNGLTLENYETPLLVTLLPQVFFLMVGLIFMQIIFKKNKFVSH